MASQHTLERTKIVYQPTRAVEQYVLNDWYTLIQFLLEGFGSIGMCPVVDEDGIESLVVVGTCWTIESESTEKAV